MSRKDWSLPRLLGRSIDDELSRLAPGRESLAVARRWEDAVGPTVARNAWPARELRDGTLVVHTRSSVWAQELSHMTRQLNEQLGPAAPAAWRFVVGPVPEAPADADRGAVSSTVVVDQKDAAAAARIAAPIGNDELREAAARAIAKSAAVHRDARPL